jgi:hypothetical protein
MHVLNLQPASPLQGDCDTAPQGPFADPKYPVKPKQCVLVTKRNVFTFVEAHNLFMSNLYFKVAPTPAPLATFQVILAENVRMWMLDVTFQRPSGQAFARGMLVKRSDLYCRGVPLAGFKIVIQKTPRDCSLCARSNGVLSLHPLNFPGSTPAPCHVASSCGSS